MNHGDDPTVRTETGPSSHPKSRLTARVLLEARRLSDPRIHPDGRRVAFVATETDFEESRFTSHLWLTEWLAPEDESQEDEGSEEGDGKDPTTDENPMPKTQNLEDLSRQLTFSRDGESSPRWSPDGRWLAFLSSRPDETQSEEDNEEEEPAEQIWAMPIDGGEARRLTQAKEGVIDFAWSPNSTEIVFLTPEPRPRPVENVRKEQRERRKIDPIVEHDDRLRRQFWRVEVEARKPKPLFTADYGVAEFELSPDGEQVCYATNHTGDPNDYHQVDLYVRPLAGGAARKLVERAGGKYHPRWSPDGRRIAYLAWLDPQISYARESLYVVEAPLVERKEDLEDKTKSNGENKKEDEIEVKTEPNEARLFTPPDFDFDLAGFVWSAKDDAIYALAHARTGSEIVRLDTRTGEFARLDLDAAPVREDLAGDPDGLALAWVEESATALPEIRFRDEQGELHTLTRLNAEIAETHLLPRQEVVTWAGRDGLPIEGIITYPLEYREGTAFPCVVQIHGGPKGRATHTLLNYHLAPVWSAEGYAVLRPNFRGSEGYGHAFAIANRRDLGGGDFDDIMAGVDWCVAQGIADPEKLGVMGGSYGGYMTNWAIGHTDRFKAAISLFGIFHLQTDYSNSSLSRWDNDYLGAYYWEDPEIFQRLSPGSYLEAIRTPTLILHGDEDDNTTLSNSREMYQALRHRGVTTQFVHYPREGHGLREPNHRLDEMRRCLAWMDRYLRHDGRIPARYRLSDEVPSTDGLLEMCVTRAEIAEYVGRPPLQKGTEAETLLEVAFTLHTPSGREAAQPLLLPLASLTLSLQEEAPTIHRPPPTVHKPVGIPIEMHGVKTLVEGEALTLTQFPDKETGQIAFALAVAYRVPRSVGEALFHMPEFPPVHLLWSLSEPEEDENSAAGLEEEKA